MRMKTKTLFSIARTVGRASWVLRLVIVVNTYWVMYVVISEL